MAIITTQEKNQGIGLELELKIEEGVMEWFKKYYSEPKAVILGAEQYEVFQLYLRNTYVSVYG